MKVYAIPVLDTNYVYVLVDKKKAVLVDPGEASPVLEALRLNEWDLQAILLTHKHHDHIGGVADILKAYPVPVYGGQDDFPIPVKPLKTVIKLLGKTIRVIDLPGHTAGGVGFYVENNLFTGDVLFGAGCGFLFEGTASQMVESLDRILALPGKTKIYFGHEYTIRNLRFSKYLEPENKAVLKRLSEGGECTTPSTLSLEKKTNPFLRLEESAIITRVNELAGREVKSRVDRFSYIRAWKTEFDDRG